jgi:parallel beta-helix repeat protein
MKTISQTLFVVCILFLSFSVCIAGSLQPTAGPGPTMKTLDQVEPRTAITSIPITIHQSGSYYLAKDFNSVSTAITIDANNVTLDLKGFTVSGTETNGSYGIFINQNHKNIEIRNGTVTGFGFSGITNFNGSNKDIRIINVRCISNKINGIYLSAKGSRIENCLAAENNGKGIYTSESAVITNCIARDNNDLGIGAYIGSVITGSSSNGNRGMGIYARGAVTISNCIARDNNDTGIYVYGGSTVSGCSSYSNGRDGIYAQGGATISNNSCYGNGWRGINSESGKMIITGNNVYSNVYGIYGSGVIKDNFVSNNSGEWGIRALAGSTVINNTAMENLGDGIEVLGPGSVVIGNSAYGNGSGPSYRYGLYIGSNCLVDLNASYNNGININTLVDCTVPSGNHAP